MPSSTIKRILTFMDETGAATIELAHPSTPVVKKQLPYEIDSVDSDSMWVRHRCGVPKKITNHRQYIARFGPDRKRMIEADTAEQRRRVERKERRCRAEECGDTELLSRALM